VPCSPPAQSFEAAPTGEHAFGYTPDPNGAGEKLNLYCGNLEAVDGPLAVATRASIEFFGAEIPVVLEPPADPACCARMLGVLGEGLPEKFRLVHEVPPERAGPGDGIILAATPISEFPEADALTERLAEELPGLLGARSAGFLASGAAALVENALAHPVGASIDPVVAITRDPASDVLRLAVYDNGTGIESDAEAEQRLAEALEKSEELEGGLVELGMQAELLGIEARLCLASGSGRLRLRESAWSIEEDQYVAGTTVILEVKSG
jgi:hypothetical protein